jgi:uncharacterized protein (DUF342 family)
MPPPDSNFQVILQELVRRSNEESRRMRTIEQRLDALEDKLNVLVAGTNERAKRTNQKLADSDAVMKAMSNDIANVKASVERITKSMAKFAQRRDLKEIERMLDLISPVNKEFVTKEELEDELRVRHGRV